MTIRKISISSNGFFNFLKNLNLLQSICL
jgi:hypothetical protein